MQSVVETGRSLHLLHRCLVQIEVSASVVSEA